MAIKFATIDSHGGVVSGLLRERGHPGTCRPRPSTTTACDDVADIDDAHKLLTPVLGAGAASCVFAVALLASGQNSTLTGTLAGQIVMEGFLDIKLKPWLRRLITRGIAVVPALIVTILYGEKGTGELLVLSQVILSLQLSFAVVPLVLFTGSKAKMGVFVNQPWLQATGLGRVGHHYRAERCICFTRSFVGARRPGHPRVETLG